MRGTSRQLPVEPPGRPVAGAGRSRLRVLVAAAGTAALVFVLMYYPDRDDGSGSLLGAVSALASVALGLAAIEGLRPIPVRNAASHLRLAGQALAAGIGLGLLNLAANYGMALGDPEIRGQMVERWAETSPWSIVVAGPVLEEIIFRLLLMSAIAWATSRVTRDRRAIFLVALGLSSAIFGVAHIFYGGVDTPLYQLGIALKTGVLALSLGWIFWRWGLPYAILAHCVANAVHLVLWPVVF